MVQALAGMNMPACAVTEQSNLFSAVKFYRAAEQLGIKPVIGAEVRLLNDDVAGPASRLTLLCQNDNGYRNLTQLITLSYTNGQVQGLPHIQRAWLHEHAEGLIALSGGRTGDVGQAILSGNEDHARALLKTWQSVFKDRYYLELQRTQRRDEEAWVVAAVHLAEEFGLPVVATHDVRFLSPDDYEAHEARVCIQHGYTLNDPRRPRHYSPEQYLCSAEDMAELFRDIPEAVENTLAIAARCNLELRLGEYFLPDFPVPDDYTQDRWLRHQSEQGLQQRFDSGFLQNVDREKYRQRLALELDVIIGMGFAGYFLIVADFIRWAKQQGIPVGPGRGSGAGSLVAYALGITELDPIHYDLLFERFLNPERVSLPDFDVDFCMDRRDEVIEYVANRYGRDHVSQIITYGTMAAKAVVRDVGRVLGYPYGFVDQIAKLIPFDLNMTLERALDEEPVLKQRYQDEENVNTLINLALKLEGLARNAGRHAGGIVIAPKALTCYMPLYCEQGSTATVSQFDMGDVEAAGLVKFDFLGLRTLTIIDHAVKDINRLHNHSPESALHIEAIPLNDPKTYELIRRTETTAIFQLESDGMKKLIKRLQPDSFDELIALVALFRPGPLQSGMVDDYIERKHGRASVHYFHPRLEPILRPTYGVILYQEQVMQIAQTLAGYTLGAADLLRRAMGKKKPEEMAQQREIFTSGAVAQGVDAKLATTIFDLMEKFAGYGFNKSHSAAYALIAYQTAWLKTHYPASFMAAVLSSDMDNTDKVVMLLDELERMQIRLEPPHINQSEYPFTVADHRTIRYGLGAVKGVGQAAIENITDDRTVHGKYKDLFDLSRRIDARRVNRRVLEALIRSGALDGLGPNRSSLMASLAPALQLAEQSHKNTVTGQDDLFGLEPVQAHGQGTAKSEFVQAPDWSDEERLQGEKETLGFYLKGHPIIRYEQELEKIVSCRLKSLRTGNVLVAGYIHRLRSRSGNRGRMAELVLDDRTSRANVTVYSDKFQQYRNLLVKDQLVIVRGEVMEDDFISSGYTIVAREIYDMQQIREKYAGIRLKLSGTVPLSATLESLQKLMASNRNGNCRVMVSYHNGTADCLLPVSDKWRVNASDGFLDSLKKLLGQDNVALEYHL